jgi:hypothetical protein
MYQQLFVAVTTVAVEASEPDNTIDWETPP